MVRLVPTDGDQGVATLGEGVRDEIFELASFVAPEGQAGVEIFAFGVDVYFSTQGGRDAGERVDGGGTQQEGIPGNGGERFGKGELILDIIRSVVCRHLEMILQYLNPRRS